jgi:intracellular multiplication protein IcmG
MAEEKPLSDVVAAALPPLFEPDVPSAPAESEDPGAAAVTPAPVSSEPQPSEPTPGSDSGTILAAGPDLEARAMITANTQAMEKISATLAQISSRVEKIDSDVSGVVKRQEEDIQSVRQSIDALRQDVTDLKNRPEPAAAPDSGRTSTGATDGSKSQAPKKAKAIDRATDPASPPTVAKAEPAKKAKADKPKTRPAPPAQSSPAALPAAKAKTEAPMPTARWELRAAQPGRAWISRAGQRDMQSVQVGQTIAGLGRVTTISYQNGRWSVVGTTGRVDQ